MNIALLLEALRSNHHSGFGIDNEPRGRMLEAPKGKTIFRKFMPIAAAALAWALAHSYSPPTAEAVPLRLDAAVCHADTDAIFVRHHWRSWRYRQRPSGVEVFIIPDLYWGPA